MRWKSLLGLSIFGIGAGLVALAADAVACCATLERQICFRDSSRICFDSVVSVGHVCVRFPRDIFPVFVKRVKHQSYESEFMGCARRSMEAKILITKKPSDTHKSACLHPFFHRSTALV